ncbi:WecB/TagA/CpsF family glycosyltransferase (plasmid) [Nostoc sp. UHCC 0302]|uniref:WecB/TagA/CpsF family glycosyltransferase n=1 Tax=Nostoc sp. UHCC 0302 TaxID=3134896 RepID=UPI00311CC4B3
MKNSLIEFNIPQALQMLDVTIHPLSISQLNALITEAVRQKQKWIFAHQNLHSIYLYHRNPKMRAFYAKAEFTHIDGMSLVFLGKLLGFSLQRQQRVTYADWMAPLMAEAAYRGWRIFYLGSKPGVAEQGAKILREEFSGLRITTAHGYFDARHDNKENQAVLEQINQYQPHVLMVGMGMPRQENWILDNLEQISANVILPCGAAIDYVAGAIPTPPRWAGKTCLEWLFRLVAEPGRLWRRYLIEPWFLLKLFLLEGWKSIQRRWLRN